MCFFFTQSAGWQWRSNTIFCTNFYLSRRLDSALTVTDGRWPEDNETCTCRNAKRNILRTIEQQSNMLPKRLGLERSRWVATSMADEMLEHRRSLNSNHHLVYFSHALLGRESGQPPAQRANVALIPAAIKSTRLVANANRPEGISAFPVSPYHTTKTTKPATFSYTKPATVFLYTPLTI